MIAACPTEYQVVLDGPSKVLIRAEWREVLLKDLLEDFAQVGPERRQVYGNGRAEHFSYLPEGGIERVFVRRLVRGGMLRPFGNLHFGIERPLQEILAVAASGRAGIPVPEILAAKATRVWGPLHRLWIVMKEISGTSNLLHAAPSLSAEGKRRTINRLAEILRRMHEVGIYHPDLTVHNIVLDADGEVHIIDFDKTRLVGSRDERLGLQVLTRLNRSLEKTLGTLGCVTRTDRIRFLRAYFGARVDVRAFTRRCFFDLLRHRLLWATLGKQ